MLFTAYEIFRLIFYVLLIGAASYSFFYKKRNIDVYILIYGVVYFIQVILDTFIFTSNLELSSCTELLMSGVFMHFMHTHLKWPKVFSAIWILQLLLLSSAFVYTLDFGVFNESVVYESKYGFLDTNENHKINMVFPFVLQIFFLATIYKVIRDEEWSNSIRVFIVYCFIFFISEMDIFIFNMITPLMFEEIDLYFEVRSRISPMIFGFVHLGLLANLLWKR